MRWPWTRTETGDGLFEALSAPTSRSVRLFGELIDRRDSRCKPLLVTAPTGIRPAALAAGDLAAAAMDAGIARLRLIDLRRQTHVAEPLLARPVDISRPAPEYLESGEKLRKWVDGLVATSEMAVILCGGVLDPRHWTEDPATWNFLAPQTILAVGEGAHTEEQVAEAAQRLRRTGLTIAGSILVRRRPRFWRRFERRAADPADIIRPQEQAREAVG